MNNITETIDFTEFKSGLRIFIKLTGLKEDPIEHKWVRDEFDLVEALSYIPYFVKQTGRFAGTHMYVKQPYDFVQDVMLDLQECLISGKESKCTAIQRKKHLTLYHLVIVPVLQMLKQFTDKKQAIQHIDELVNTLQQFVLTHNIYTNYQDALVAKKQVGEIIQKRTSAEDTIKQRRRRKCINF